MDSNQRYESPYCLPRSQRHLAQFEREVTGEGIRDKIAASKRKGIWMGVVPLGSLPIRRTAPGFGGVPHGLFRDQ
jgi:hypothetical protein